MAGSASHSLAHGGIAYLRDEIVRLEKVEKASAYQSRSRVRPSSAVGLALYMSRGRGRDDVQGRSYDFTGKVDELVHHEVLLPLGAPEMLRDPVVLWSAAQAADMTRPRKGQPSRPKVGAQVAIATVLALPRALELGAQIELVRRWCAIHYPDVAVQIDIHDPLIAARNQGAEATREDCPNIHAHLLRTTRKVGPDGLGKKVRPEYRVDGIRFSASGRVSHGSDWPKRWADFQNEFFEEKGLTLQVAPVSLSPALHLGKKAARRPDSWAKQENAIRQVEAKAAMRQSDEVVRYLREWRPVYQPADLVSIARVHGIAISRPEDVAKRLAQHWRVEQLFDADTGEPAKMWRIRAADEPAPDPQPVLSPARQTAAKEARHHNVLVAEEALMVRIRRRLATLLRRLRQVLQAAEHEAEAAAARDGWSGGAAPSGKSAFETLASSLFIHPSLDPAALARLEYDVARWSDLNRQTCRRRTERALRTTQNPGFARGLDLLDSADAAATARQRILASPAPAREPPSRCRSKPDDDALAADLAADMAVRAERHQQARRERHRALRRERQR